MTVMPDALCLSPHLDDAALSCGGGIVSRVRAGQRVRVITVFTADEPAGDLPPLARELHAAFQLEAGVVTARRAEDAAAMRALGCDFSHWDETEGIYRRHPVSGAPLYPDRTTLFGPVADGDDGALERLCRRLAALPPAACVRVPLGIGGQVDHRLVRQAAEACIDPGRLVYYEDYPYVERPLALWRVLRWRRGWRARRESVDQDSLAAQLAAIACYGSQVGPLFGGVERMRRRVSAHWNCRGRAERVWIRTRM